MKIKHLIIIVMVISCRDKIKNNLIENNSVWLYAIKDATNNNNEKTMKLQFYNNGIVDEVDTDFIKYYWAYSGVNKTIAINSQEFKILSTKDNTIYLKHTKTGLEARLTKIR